MGTPKRFNKVRQRVFFETLAKTCNVTQACRAADVDSGTVYYHRQKDEVFRAEWEEALALGLADLELALLERAKREKPAADQDEAGELVDPELAKYLWRHHRVGESRTVPRGRKPAAAEWRDVEEWFIAKLALLKKRMALDPVESER